MVRVWAYKTNSSSTPKVRGAFEVVDKAIAESIMFVPVALVVMLASCRVGFSTSKWLFTGMVVFLKEQIVLGPVLMVDLC